MVYLTYMPGHSQTDGGARQLVRDPTYMPGTTYNFWKMRALTEYGRKMVCFKVFTLLDRVVEREVGFCNCMEVSMGCVTELPHHALLRGLHEN